ncbi:hypothetical protein TEQG_06921 [Trichophyton equinum CBS 127.97]|uniref:Uncharacterized protein n=1 Tax=Trichophyton equinum (strain ATCC MYA-4606 / CBS 127.97) TaxID=559882 RepID=F2Q171_TRIEC|nr:hypothetical protein TEQG_06921 [Trichophyton equinum CBS 127.97]
MSHAVHITTRVLEEQVARTVKFGRDGEPISETPASHPIGTTVRVCNFLQSLPVRRQEAEKKSTKSILAIKKLLQGYAIARPKTRLSMRLLKSKEQDWIYAPSPSPSARDAISQIIGSTVISSCISLNSCHPVTRGRDSSDSVIEGHDTLTIHVSVVVPKPAADNRAVLHIIESVFMDIYSPETSTITPTPDTRQSNQLTVDISSPASTKNCGRFRTNETLTPTINPWTLSLAAQRLRDPESHLLTPQREFQAPQNNLPPRSPNISMKGGRASMRQAKLSLHDNGRVSLFDTQSPRRRINGSPRTATPPQVPAPNITRGIETSLQTAERNSTRGNGGAHVIRPAPPTPPLSRACSITTRQQAPIAVTCSRSNDPIFPNPHYISERLHRNHSSDHENSGYCEIHPSKLTVPSGSRLYTISTNLKSRFQPDLNQKCNHLTNHGKNSFSTEILRDQSQSPMECLPSMGPTYETTIPNGGEITQLADSIKRLVNTDQYVKSGSFMAAFSPVNSTGSISYWTNKLHTLAKKPSFQRRLRQLSFLAPDNLS